VSPDPLAAAVATALGAEVTDARPVHGGSINRALRLTLADGRAAFVKHHPDAPPGVFRAEADGLAWLAEAGALRTPEVLAVADDGDGPRFLALEWIAPGPPDPEAFGRGLAGLHRAGAPAFGWERDNFIGPLPQPNHPVPGGWPEFYVTRRLLPMAERAVAAGTLDTGFLAALERLRARMPDLAGEPEPPARLHGDLWNGNVLWGADGDVRLIDPAAHGGHRETDLAMLALFGCPHLGAVLDGYREAAPLADGWETRVGVHQLFPLLVHAVLFGRGHAEQALAAAQAAAAG
jgi:fructosamine-3-kinase